MAAFPSIEPIGRQHSLRSFPVTAATFANGDQTRFRWGTVATGAPVQLTFNALTVAQAQQIRDHYLGQRDSQPFTVPAETWRLHTDQYQMVPADQYYLYAGPPQETRRIGSLVDVEVSLITTT